MPSRISNPSAGTKIIGVFQTGEGGHGKQTAREGLLALGGFPASDIGHADNCIPLNADGLINRSFFGDIQVVETAIDGPTTVARGSLNIYLLTTFDSFMKYEVSAERGSIEIQGKVIYYRAPMSTGEDTLQVDTRTFKVMVTGVEFVKPEILSPGVDVEVGSPDVIFTSSTAQILNNPGTEQHDSSDWELSETADFAVLSRYAYQYQGLTAWAVSGLQVGKDYYARVRYNGRHGSSDWSEVAHVKVIQPSSIAKPAIIFPLNHGFVSSQDFAIMTTAFITEGYTDVHQSTDWIISTTSNFASVAEQSLLDAANKLSYVPTSLQAMTLYYVKARFHGAEKVSEWTDPISFVLDDSI